MKAAILCHHVTAVAQDVDLLCCLAILHILHSVCKKDVSYGHSAVHNTNTGVHKWFVS